MEKLQTQIEQLNTLETKVSQVESGGQTFDTLSQSTRGVTNPVPIEQGVTPLDKALTKEVAQGRVNNDMPELTNMDPKESALWSQGILQKEQGVSPK